MRVKIIFSYDGSKFNGFQKQKNALTVQGSIENALKEIYGEEIPIKGAGRTDAKVHANGQVAHFDVDNVDSYLLKKMNNILNPNIVIRKLNKVNDDFHARHSAKKKKYIYKINVGAYLSALNDYYYQPRYKLDLGLMKQAARYMIGTHDFHNFVAGKRDNYISTIYNIEIYKTFKKIEIHFIGVGFYRYMVRNLVGALLEVGKCKVPSIVIRNMLENPEKKVELPTAEPEGLYLDKIWY